VKHKEVNWVEWVANSLLCFALAGVFHAISVHSATADVETWSGQVTHAKQYSAWKEYYEYAVYKTEYYTDTESYTDSNGKHRTRTVTKSRRVFDRWESTSRWHHESWTAFTNIDKNISIDKNTFTELCKKFQDHQAVPGKRRTGERNSRMIGGDPNDYESKNRSGWVEPVTKIVAFENKIRATPSSFSFAKVPEGMKGLFEYPKNAHPFVSDRLVGSAPATIDQLTFDQMNARLGPKKRVNVIMLGMGDVNSMMGEWQRAKWIGGKKNDVVIVWGGLNKKPSWVKVFGWTDEEICKRNLETIVLKNGATTDVLPLIETEIKNTYKLKNWEKSFAHIRVPAPAWAMWTYFSVMVVAQFILWFLFMNNNYGKEIEQPFSNDPFKSKWEWRSAVPPPKWK
jgi:hypothetical protein